MAAALDPLYQQFQARGLKDFGAFLQQHADEAGRQILSVAEQKVATSQIAAVRSSWPRFRGTAETEMAVLAPKLGKMLSAYLGSPT